MTPLTFPLSLARGFFSHYTKYLTAFLKVKHSSVGLPNTTAFRNFSFLYQSTLNFQQFMKITIYVFLPVYGSSSFCSE